MPEWTRVERVGDVNAKVTKTAQVAVTDELNYKPDDDWVTIYASIYSEYPRSGACVPEDRGLPARINFECPPDHLEDAIAAIDARLARANDLYEEAHLPARLAREAEERLAQQTIENLKADISERAARLSRPRPPLDV